MQDVCYHEMEMIVNFAVVKLEMKLHTYLDLNQLWQMLQHTTAPTTGAAVTCISVAGKAGFNGGSMMALVFVAYMEERRYRHIGIIRPHSIGVV